MHHLGVGASNAYRRVLVITNPRIGSCAPRPCPTGPD